MFEKNNFWSSTFKKAERRHDNCQRHRSLVNYGMKNLHLERTIWSTVIQRPMHIWKHEEFNAIQNILMAGERILVRKNSGIDNYSLIKTWRSVVFKIFQNLLMVWILSQYFKMKHIKPPSPWEFPPHESSSHET